MALQPVYKATKIKFKQIKQKRINITFQLKKLTTRMY